MDSKDYSPVLLVMSKSFCEERRSEDRDHFSGCSIFYENQLVFRDHTAHQVAGDLAHQDMSNAGGGYASLCITNSLFSIAFIQVYDVCIVIVMQNLT